MSCSRLRDDAAQRVGGGTGDGVIVGFGSPHIEPQLHHVGLAGEIQELVVHETVRSEGIGAELVSRLEERVKKLGCASLEVTTRKKWVDAQRFYERVGFKKTHVNFTKALITQKHQLKVMPDRTVSAMIVAGLSSYGVWNTSSGFQVRAALVWWMRYAGRMG